MGIGEGRGAHLTRARGSGFGAAVGVGGRNPREAGEEDREETKEEGTGKQQKLRMPGGGREGCT
jgi:hypothetical protein